MGKNNRKRVLGDGSENLGKSEIAEVNRIAWRRHNMQPFIYSLLKEKIMDGDDDDDDDDESGVNLNSLHSFLWLLFY